MYKLSFSNLYRHKKGRVFVHILFWVSYSCLLGAKHILNGEIRTGLIGSLPGWMPDILTFYFLAYIVFPITIYKEKYIAFAVSLVFTFIVYLVADYASFWIRLHFFTGTDENVYTLKYYQDRIAGGLWNRFSKPGMLLTLFFELLYIIAFPIVIKVSRDILKLHHKALLLQKENLQIELKFLKAQLNPHFLFNTLNNLDSLIVLNRNKEASETTIRLSQFMRYTLYECDDEFIELSKEVTLIKNYVELERIRNQGLKIEMKFSAGNNNYFIPPLILLPFVENSFKHGVNSGVSNPQINISLDVKGEDLVFIVENKVFKQKTDEKGGIGLNNIKARLQYYYPEKHELLIKEDYDWYRIQLKITACQKQ